MERNSIMNARPIHDHKAIASETFVPATTSDNSLIPATTPQENTIGSIEMGPDWILDSDGEKHRDKPVHKALAHRSAMQFAAGWQQTEISTYRPPPRIAFKIKGRIIFMDLAEIVAVQAAGGYVSLEHRPNPYLLRESLSSVAEKLRPHGFIRIHRSVVVNTSVVEEIKPLQTGEYKLRVKGGKEYMVARRYKDNLRYLAQLWLGSSPGGRSKTS
jgi:hypothetical protein